MGDQEKKNLAIVGDVINGWKIINIYTKDIGSQNVRMAKVESTINDKVGEYRLTLLTKKSVGWPDRRRPDIKLRKSSHGLTDHRLYTIWSGMKSRCLNPKQLSYKNYGGKGIKICEEWLDFQKFYDWAINNGYDDKLTLDRIKSDKDYKPSNCQWATFKEQIDNRIISINITAFGETKNASDWSLDERCNCSYWTLLYRIKQEWDSEKAITKKSPKGKDDNFRRYKTFYKFIEQKYPKLIEEYLQQT